MKNERVENGVQLPPTEWSVLELTEGASGCSHGGRCLLRPEFLKWLKWSLGTEGTERFRKHVEANLGPVRYRRG